jgi:hypothetical protein
MLQAEREKQDKLLEKEVELEKVNKRLEGARLQKLQREVDESHEVEAAGKAKRDALARKADETKRIADEKAEAEAEAEADKDKKKAERRGREEVTREKVEFDTGLLEPGPAQVEGAEAAPAAAAERGKSLKKTSTLWSDMKSPERDEVAARVVGKQTYTEVRLELVQVAQTELGLGIKRTSKKEQWFLAGTR